MDEQKELRDNFRQQQEKYVYYVIALAVTAIGFAIYKTSGQPLKWTQIPLGLSVLSWGISIYCGLTFLKYVISTLFANNAYFDIIRGQYPGVGKDPEKVLGATKGIKTAIESNIKTAERYFNWKQRLFYSGVILFIFWHILEMYHMTRVLTN